MMSQGIMYPINEILEKNQLSIQKSLKGKLEPLDYLNNVKIGPLTEKMT